jgi:hypothetical protein
MDSKWQLVFGRVLLSVIFILSGVAKGIPLASVALVITLFIEIGGG